MGNAMFEAIACGTEARAVKNMKIEIPETELLAGLAEEAAELAQAALKLRRAIDGTNPTPYGKDVCYASLMEELSNVELYLEQLEIDRDMVEAVKEAKRARWVSRLKLSTGLSTM